ncbi:hypothetical protein LTR84_009359 [Exophiala bonariae]|uniref:HNH nuclease domain-containing protein n=1 Tax=Exophiala bonariae TaxID=1690606 RepID=A0AAV9MUC9_9EURO|nr:hypothetical protein LTR84_009359 [Exophiala bonariae]
MPITLLELPTEIRDQIWNLAFKTHLVVPTSGQASIYQQVGCLACQKGDHVKPNLWAEVFRPLLTCRQIYDEASAILFGSFMVCFGDRIFTMESLRPPFPGINTKVTSVAIWVHVNDDNRVHWSEGLKSMGDAFPNLKHLTIKAHMRPPNSYELLVDAITLATPIVRYTRDKRDMEVNLEFDYTYEDIMFDSPYLGVIRTTDALEEHELVIRDLIEDDAFVEAALSEDEDEQAMVAALLRTARAHEQSWFEKLQRNRAARQRAEEQSAPVPDVQPTSDGPPTHSAAD